MKNLSLISFYDGIGYLGRVRICAWEPGVLSYLMDKNGMTLTQAMAAAEKMGARIYERLTHNLITTAGKQFIAKRISGQETVGLTYFGLGTGTAAPTIADTQLATETLRQTLTQCYQGDVYIYSSAFFLANVCSFNIQEGGLFGGAAATLAANSGSMMCRFLIGNNNTTTQYDLTMQHTAEVMS